MVCGHHRTIAGDGSLQAQWPAFHPPGGHYYGLLQGNFVAAIHSAMFRRDALATLGGFDTSFRAAEDYDLYLRLARRFPMHCHGVEVAEYRRRPSSMTPGDPVIVCSPRHSRRCAARAPPLRGDRVLREAHRAGIAWWREFYGRRLAAEVRNAVPATGAPASRRVDSRAALSTWASIEPAEPPARRPSVAKRGDLRRRPPAVASFDGPADALAWLTGELEHRDQVLAQRDQAIAWLEQKLAEARATVEARDAAIAWLKSQAPRPRTAAEGGPKA